MLLVQLFSKDMQKKNKMHITNFDEKLIVKWTLIDRPPANLKIINICLLKTNRKKLTDRNNNPGIYILDSRIAIV